MDSSPFRRVASAGKGLAKPTVKLIRRLSLHDPGARNVPNNATLNSASSNNSHPGPCPTSSTIPDLAWLGSKSSAEDIALAFSQPQESASPATAESQTESISSATEVTPTTENSVLDPPPSITWSLRQSMRRLTPMRLSNRLSTHANRSEPQSPSEDSHLVSSGLASVSPQTNEILVTSLMNTVMANSPAPAPVEQQISRFVVTQTPVSITGDYASMTSSTSASTLPANEASRRDRQHGRAGRRREEQNQNQSQSAEGGNHERPSARQSRSANSRSRRTSPANSRRNSRRTYGRSTSSPSSISASGARRSHHRRRRTSESSSLDPEEESRRQKVSLWQHKASPFFASLACTLGLYNIDRFALLTVEYGGNFLIEFMILSFVFGIPLYCFQGCLGQYLGSGIVRMWRLSPIFKGVGISFLLTQIFLGLYTVVGVAWMFFYFRDSFISPADDRFRWQKCSDSFQLCGEVNKGADLMDTLPDYFHGRVLQRTRETIDNPPMYFVNLKFETTFNLAVIWMIVFVSLGKGIRSYGKVVYAFGIFPIIGYFMVCIKILGLSSSYPAIGGNGGLLSNTAWGDFFTNSTAWVVAAREVFFTWALLGPVIMQITANNRQTHSLRRDTTAVVLMTFLVLLLSGFLASACIQILAKNSYYYDRTASSYEKTEFYKFLTKEGNELTYRRQQQYHMSYIMGVEIKPNEPNNTAYFRSGYTPLRFATEIFPALISTLGPNELSPFWTVLFYFSLISFGIGQQIALWYGVINGIISFRSCCLKAWQTTITFFACAAGFLLSLPFATEMGITILYLVDYAFGTGWWLMILYVLQISAVLIVRGRPYNAENIVSVLVKGSGCLSNWCNPLLTFCWSIVLPISFVVLAVASFKTGYYSRVFIWADESGYRTWTVWARKMACAIQLLPLLLIPVVGLVQCFRYLCHGHSDLFEKIKALYRPSLDNEESDFESEETTTRRTRPRAERSRSPSPPPVPAPDPPPKYTPPPTYNTATGARIAKLFRESIRRSFRQIRDITNHTVTSLAELELGSRLHGHADEYSDMNALTISSTSHLPDYTSVELENAPSTTNVNEIDEERSAERSGFHGNAAAGTDSQNVEDCAQRLSTERKENATSSTSSGDSVNSNTPLTAAEVTRLLRSSMRQSGKHVPSRGPVTIVEPQRDLEDEEASHVNKELDAEVRAVKCDSRNHPEEDNLVSVTLPSLMVSNAESFA